MDNIFLFTKALKVTDPWYIEDIELDPLQHRLNIRINFKRGSTFKYQDESTQDIKHYKAYDTEEKV